MEELNAESFDDKISQERPVVVDFWAEWCSPCKMLAPIFERVSEEIDADFAKVNVEENSELAQKFEVRGIPCIVVFKNREEVDRIVGFVNEERLKAKLSEILEGA